MRAIVRRIAEDGCDMELFFHWLRFGVIVWGLAYIVTQSSIILPLRLFVLKRSNFLGALIFCPACSSFWIGVLLGALGLYGPPLAPLSVSWLESALISTVLGYFWGTYFGDPHGYTKAAYSVLGRDEEPST